MTKRPSWGFGGESYMRGYHPRETMLTAINPTVRRARLVFALALTACSSDTIMVGREIGEGNTYITVINDGTVALSTLRIPLCHE